MCGNAGIRKTRHEAVVRFGATVLLREIRRVTLSSDSDDVGTVLLCSVMDGLNLFTANQATDSCRSARWPTLTELQLVAMCLRSNDWRLQVDAIARQLEVPSPRLQPAEQFAMMGLFRAGSGCPSTLGADSVGRNAMPSQATIVVGSTNH